MKTLKVIIVIVTLVLFYFIMGINKDIDMDDMNAFEAFGRTIFFVLILIGAIAAYKAADKEQRKWEK